MHRRPVDGDLDDAVDKHNGPVNYVTRQAPRGGSTEDRRLRVLRPPPPPLKYGNNADLWRGDCIRTTRSRNGRIRRLRRGSRVEHQLESGRRPEVARRRNAAADAGAASELCESMKRRLRVADRTAGSCRLASYQYSSRYQYIISDEDDVVVVAEVVAVKPTSTLHSVVEQRQHR